MYSKSFPEKAHDLIIKLSNCFLNKQINMDAIQIWHMIPRLTKNHIKEEME